MLGDLLARGRIESAFQPLVHRASGRVVGYEALARGPAGHPLERPDRLFAAARAEGRLAEVDWVCRASAFAGATRAGLRSPTALFVNVEAEVFDAPVPPEHAEALRRASAGLRVLYEVTERGLTARPAEMLAEVERVRALGFGIAVDDLGADWRSLALLAFIRPDVVKIDIALIQAPLTDRVMQVADAVRAYAKDSCAQIVAEGIETDFHEARADVFGADLGQGYKYGRPGPLTAAAAKRIDLAERLVIDTRPVEPATPAMIALAAPARAVATTDALQRLSIEIQTRALAIAEPCVVLAAFPSAEHFDSPGSRERFSRLAAGEAFVATFGTAMAAEPVPGVRGAPLDTNAPLAAEWHIIVVGAHHAEALIARDLRDHAADTQRRYEFVHTHDRELIIRAARSLMLTIPPATASAQSTRPGRSTSGTGAAYPDKQQRQSG